MTEMTLADGEPAVSFEFNDGIKQALRGRLAPDASLEELIEQAAGPDGMFFLFRQLAEDTGMKRLLFQRHDDLFPTDDGVSLPLLYQGRIVDAHGIEQRTIQSKALAHVVAMEVDYTQQNQTALQNAIGLSQEDIEEAATELADVFAYGALLVLEDNPALLEVLRRDEKLTLASVREVLRAQGHEIDVSSLEALGNALEDEDDTLDPQVQNVVRRLATKTALGVLSVLEQPNTPSSPLPNLATSAHGPVSRWYPRVLEQTDLDPDEYGNLLNELYRLNLVRARDVICWCERCSLKTTSYTKHYGEVAPAELHEERCLCCGRSSSHTALYSVDPAFRDLLFSKDGFLAVYLGWLLTQNEIPFEASHTDVDPEADFLIDDSILIECKMLRANRDARQAKSSLNAALGQVRKQVEAREQAGYDIEQVAVAWNRWENVAPSGLSVADRYEELILDYQLQVVGPHQIERFVDEL